MSSDPRNSALRRIRAPAAAGDPSVPEIAIRAERRRLAKRVWRAVADDGLEFGFELEAPLEDGAVIWADERARYVIRQLAEPVLEISLEGAPAAAVFGWAVGNLHIPIEARATQLLTPDEPGLRAMLDRLGIPYRGATGVFRPHRLAAKLTGASHRHVPPVQASSGGLEVVVNGRSDASSSATGKPPDGAAPTPRGPSFTSAVAPAAGGAAWLPGLLQAVDSLYPTGAYAHSYGLEGLVQAGVVHDSASLRTFLLESVASSLAGAEMPVAARAWTAAGDPPDWERLHRLCLLGSSLRGAREPREAALAIGRQRLELAARLRGGIAADLERHAAAGEWPVPACVAVAVEGRALGAPAEAVLGALFYGTMAGLAAAAVKLLRLGQNVCQALLAEVLAGGPRCVAEALARDDAEVGAFNPWWDIAASRHETADSRLFIS